ncbi:MAG: protein phosphatase CheZ, partial [Alphaproteobacteria bacterium]
LSGLFMYVKRMRQEIAAISRPGDEELQFESTGEQLDAIVQATEKATNTIMEATEESLGAIDELRAVLSDPAQVALLDKVVGNGNTILEACSFQDITGQRVTKVVKSITYVEERVNALVDLWGKDELDKVEVKGEEKTDDEKLLAGPQMEGKGLDQAAIDALFD